MMRFVAIFLLLVILAGCCSAGSCPVNYNSVYEQEDLTEDR